MWSIKVIKYNSQENDVEKYIPWIDVAKGIGIILVVIGHCMFPLHILIDSFHMPLFFVIAGLTLNVKSSPFAFLKKKIKRIMLPFAFWYAMSWIIGINNSPLWFLYTLFFAIVLSYTIIRLIPSMKVIALFVFFLSLLFWGKVSLMEYIPIVLGRIGCAMIYIIVGFVCKLLIITPPKKILRFEDNKKIAT